MKPLNILINCPIPIEFNAAKQIFMLKAVDDMSGCKIATFKDKNTSISAIMSGPGKARTAQAVSAAMFSLNPDIILDTGTCAGIMPGLTVGDIIIGKKCIEFDISGYGFPTKRIKEMELVSCFHFFSSEIKDRLLQEAVQHSRTGGYSVSVGYQACGEFLINNIALRDTLHSLFHVSGSNWETAGVFISALRNRKPVMSIRTVSDMGNVDAIREFRANAKKCAINLYQYLKVLVEKEWFRAVSEQWRALDESVRSKSPKTVLP